VSAPPAPSLRAQVACRNLPTDFSGNQVCCEAALIPCSFHPSKDQHQSTFQDKYGHGSLVEAPRCRVNCRAPSDYLFGSGIHLSLEQIEQKGTDQIA